LTGIEHQHFKLFIGSYHKLKLSTLIYNIQTTSTMARSWLVETDWWCYSP